MERCKRQDCFLPLRKEVGFWTAFEHADSVLGTEELDPKPYPVKSCHDIVFEQETMEGNEYSRRGGHALVHSEGHHIRHGGLLSWTVFDCRNIC
jgi:hypothetical protein